MDSECVNSKTKTHTWAYTGEGFLSLPWRILGMSWPQVKSPMVKSLFLISPVWLVSPDTRDFRALDCPTRKGHTDPALAQLTRVPPTSYAVCVPAGLGFEDPEKGAHRAEGPAAGLLGESTVKGVVRGFRSHM